ncbi:hypothetical protein [Gaoshiqia sediminis]|uniref:Uncharacterized protein n=1 Tax=Gaoshiqia sediminis TaxID=2986998 RepID=A0AA41Y6V5_9BACT|nr:hypothetical protein [Gaoshiqia sediminis]MCW0484521.1 hypothetical protein [Gaoshiqia sediminis]
MNRKLVDYAYNTLADNENLRLENGSNACGASSWAPSLSYHQGLFDLGTSGDKLQKY